MVGKAVTAVLGQRRGLDRHRVDLVVEVEVERQLVGQAAVQRDPAALVDAQEVDLARSVDGGDADPRDDEERGEDLRGGLQAPAPGRGGRLGPRRPALGRGAHALGVEPSLLGARADQGRVVRQFGVVGLLEPEGDHRDVVATTGLVGLGHQAGRRLVEVPRRLQHLGDALVPDHRRQAVRADQEHVAGAGAEGERVDLDLGLGAQRPGDDRPLRMILGLLVGEPALAPQLLDQRVIGGEQPELAVAIDVGATVADVRERDLVALHHGRGQRRPHPRMALVVLGEAVDALVCGLGDRAQVRLARLARLAERTADSNESAAILDATSPAWAPPIPSATANTGPWT